MDDQITYRRSELYEQVWKDPVRDVARSYGISDVWLAKICRKLSVPRPPRGYWLRMRNGWPEKRLPLPRKPVVHSPRGRTMRRVFDSVQTFVARRKVAFGPACNPQETDRVSVGTRKMVYGRRLARLRSVCPLG